MDDPFDLPPDVLRRVPLFAELSKVLSWAGGPVNWDLARQIAISIAAGDSTDASIDEADRSAIDDHVRLAEGWLVEATGFERSDTMTGRAASRVEWAEQASVSLRDLIDPVASKISAAMAEQSAAAGGADQAAMLTNALGQMAPMFMGIQAGSLVGALAREVTGAHDLGFPTDEDTVVLVLPAIDGIAEDYALDRTVLRQWIALRAVAHRLTFDGFARTRFFALYHTFVAALDFDLGESIRRLQELDLTDPSRVQDALGDGGLFAHEPSQESRSAARGIANLCSVVSAAADAACDAASTRLGDTTRVGEALRRRGDNESVRMLSHFLGLDAHTSDDAAAFVRVVLGARGWSALARAWAQPDAFPTDTELTDPLGWMERTA